MPRVDPLLTALDVNGLIPKSKADRAYNWGRERKLLKVEDWWQRRLAERCQLEHLDVFMLGVDYASQRGTPWLKWVAKTALFRDFALSAPEYEIYPPNFYEMWWAMAGDVPSSNRMRRPPRRLDDQNYRRTTLKERVPALRFERPGLYDQRLAEYLRNA